MPANILVVEDEPAIQELIAVNLEHAGHHVIRSNDAEGALGIVRNTLPDLLLIDWMLPGMSGVALARQLRQEERTKQIPIILLTARSAETDKIAGLEAGADDYVTKPFAFEELLARVEALGRRPKEIRAPLLQVGDLELDMATREVRRAGELIELTPKEYTVLEYLMRHAGKVMSRTLITEYAWDYHFDPGTNIVDVVINRLRKKVDSGHAQKLVHTVRGVGYVVKA